MRASGNGDKIRCTENLLAIVRGEVPFDRVRGLDVRPIDGVVEEAAEAIRQDAKWVVETYEPRVKVESIQISNKDGSSGNFLISANVR